MLKAGQEAKAPKLVDPTLNVGEQLPAVLPQQPAAPLELTRREMLKRAGAQAFGAATDVSPLGALAKAVAPTVAKQAVRSAVKKAAPIPKLTDLDHATRDALWWSFEESADEIGGRGIGAAAFWRNLRPQLKTVMSPEDARYFDSLARKAGKNADQDSEYTEELLDALKGATQDLPPELIMRAAPPEFTWFSEPTPENFRGWLNAVVEENELAPKAEEFETTYQRLFGSEQAPPAPTAVSPSAALRKQINALTAPYGKQGWPRMATPEDRAAYDELSERLWEAERSERK
jgi:hypothetical protein